MKRVLLIVDYFGPQPPWFPFYIETCKYNTTIDWLFNCDSLDTGLVAKNIFYNKMSFNHYVATAANVLGLSQVSFSPYKICDLRPMYGMIHAEAIKGYDFYGYTDLDILYGQLRNFIDDSLNDSNTISTHQWILSGHFALFRNTSMLHEAFLSIPSWAELLADPCYKSLDETYFSKVFKYPSGLNAASRQAHDRFHEKTAKYRTGNAWTEQFSTPFIPKQWHDGTDEHPECWFWDRGRVSNTMWPARDYMYLHFMNFKNGRYLHPRYVDYQHWGKEGCKISEFSGDPISNIWLDKHGIAVNREIAGR